MTDPANGTGGGGREPVLLAGGITAVVAALLAAFWAVTSDLEILTKLQPTTHDLINAAIIAVVALLANAWARGQVTPIRAAVLAIGTRLRTPSGTDAVVTKSGATE